MSSIQYIVVRKDLVPIMGVGKTAAQVAHASLGVASSSQ
jgi:peptidyl-tRNA hydrolase